MTQIAARPTSLRHADQQLVIVLVGIDGAGKTTAAHALKERLESFMPTRVMANYSGRRTMTRWTNSLGIAVPPRLLDLAESAVRSVNVGMNLVRTRNFDGVVIMDRHLHCQQALRRTRGLRRGRLLAALITLLPALDAVVFLDVTPEEAHSRIALRGTDTEKLEDLHAYGAGYLGLSELDSFHQIAAGRLLANILDDLENLIRQLQQGKPTDIDVPLRTPSALPPTRFRYHPARQYRAGNRPVDLSGSSHRIPVVSET
ncbi:nucleoside/nucleotide kinase family protein [Arthrobacter sp. MDT2-16]